jgi:hypothetical protein
MSGNAEATMSADNLRGDIPPSLVCPGPRLSGETGRWPSGWLPIALFVMAVVTTAGGIALFMSHVGSWLAPAAFVAGPFFFLSAVAVDLGLGRERRLEETEEKACQNDCRDLYWALNDIEDRTLKGLAWVNYRQLRGFIGIAQRQARMSFYTSLVAAAISLLVLTSMAAVAIGVPTTAAKITAGLLATAGSVLSGFLAKTFLTSYQMASLQMSYYYGQPLVHCYLLLAKWLAAQGREEFGDAEGRVLLREVIDASITAAAAAQDHLLSLQDHGPDRRRTGPVRRPRVPEPFGPLPGAN